MKLDAQTKQFDITVIGEEPHLAYNRVGLSTFFELKSVEDLYLNPQEWVGLFRLFTSYPLPNQLIVQLPRRLVFIPDQHPCHANRPIL